MFNLSNHSLRFTVLKYTVLLILNVAHIGSFSQSPSIDFPRLPLSSLEKQLQRKEVSSHHHILPLAYGMDTLERVIAQPDSIRPKSTKKRLELIPFGLVAGGLQDERNRNPIGEFCAGAMLQFESQNRWHASAGASYNLLRGPDYLQRFMRDSHIIPGVDVLADSSNKNTHSALYTFGRVSYKAGKYFHFELGKGKHFLGDGYRSLILSDLSANYPYLRMTTQIGKVKYTNLWAQMRDMTFGFEPNDLRRKYIALHSLSYNVTSRLNLTIYEMVVWQNKDKNSERNLDIHYLNPIIFYRPVEYAQGSADNVLLAASARFKATKKIQAYAQVVLDEFNLTQLRSQNKWWADKFGGQLGIKVFDLLTPGLHLQAEVNAVRPFTYTHGSPVQAWTNLNQPLAHPLGTNFAELVSIIRYEINGWTLTEQVNWSGYGRDRDVDGDGISDNLGGDIFRSYRKPFRIYANTLMQGNKHTLVFNQLTLGRAIWKNQLQVFASYNMRVEKNQVAQFTDHFVMVGISTSGLQRPTRDF